VKFLLFLVHLVVATPGRILDLLNKGLIKTDNCKVLVLDEVKWQISSHRCCMWKVIPKPVACRVALISQFMCPHSGTSQSCRTMDTAQLTRVINTVYGLLIVVHVHACLAHGRIPQHGGWELNSGPIVFKPINPTTILVSHYNPSLEVVLIFLLTKLLLRD